VFRRLCLIVAFALVVLARVGAQQQAARIHGTVIDADGRSVPSAAVELTDPLGAVLQQSTTAADGRFVFAGVAPGRFTIRTRPSGAAEHAASLSFTVEACRWPANRWRRRRRASGAARCRTRLPPCRDGRRRITASSTPVVSMTASCM